MKNKSEIVKKILFVVLIFIIILIFVLIGRYNREIASAAKEIVGNTIVNNIANTISAGSLQAKQEDLAIVATENSKINGNSMWSGSFNLAWQDIKNDLAKQNIMFNPQADSADKLNNSQFTIDNIKDEDYYKSWGQLNETVETQIFAGLQEKFGEKSKLLSKLNWATGETNDYLIYSMLKKQFEFDQSFDNLDKAGFNGNGTNIKYFGFLPNMNSNARKQVNVLYYNNENDKAISIKNSANDEIIIARIANTESQENSGNLDNSENLETNSKSNANSNKNTAKSAENKTSEATSGANSELKGEDFLSLYNEIKAKNEAYTGSKSITNTETLAIPNLQINSEKEYTELEGKTFKDASGKEYNLSKAIQSINFSLDRSGGQVVSDSVATNDNGAENADSQEDRNFKFDGSLVVFLKQADKDMPYFAINVTDITYFQK